MIQIIYAFATNNHFSQQFIMCGAPHRNSIISKNREYEEGAKGICHGLFLKMKPGLQ